LLEFVRELVFSSNSFCIWRLFTQVFRAIIMRHSISTLSILCIKIY